MDLKNKINDLLKILKIEYSDRFDMIMGISKNINNDNYIDNKTQTSKLNKELIVINESNLKLQQSLTKYINMYLLDINDINEINDDIIESYDDYLELTIDGDIIYDINHPYFYDDSFYNDLLDYYIKIEKYIKCNELKNIKRNFIF